MKKSLTSLLVAIVVAGLMTASAIAQDTKLVKSVIGGGGSVAAKNNSEYVLNGVTGQSVIETKSDQTPGSGAWNLNQGFWVPDGFKEVGVNDDPMTAEKGIYNFPNPVKNSTTIEYNLDNAAYVTLKIYDMAGNEIKVVQDGFQSAGPQKVDWNVKNDSGVDVSAGSYLYELQVRSASVAGSGSFNNFSLRNIMVVVR
ncbi:MAG: FlgD immunoglobulin-like domain containing protein [Candidatus Kapabacteria bacterium]|nr:FlgD immunoglobulin-like domain containing protein [Candidatus Kapabacteria bacterium]